MLIIEVEVIKELLDMGNSARRGGLKGDRTCRSVEALSLCVEFPKVWMVGDIHEVDVLLLQTELLAFGDSAVDCE